MVDASGLNSVYIAVVEPGAVPEMLPHSYAFRYLSRNQCTRKNKSRYKIMTKKRNKNNFNPVKSLVHQS